MAQRELYLQKLLEEQKGIEKYSKYISPEDLTALNNLREKFDMFKDYGNKELYDVYRQAYDCYFVKPGDKYFVLLAFPINGYGFGNPSRFDYTPCGESRSYGLFSSIENARESLPMNAGYGMDCENRFFKMVLIGSVSSPSNLVDLDKPIRF